MIENLVNLHVLGENKICRGLLPFTVVLFVVIANFLTFLVVPNELVMGAVQRLFYFHVGAAMATYALVGLLFVASIFYLSGQKREWDVIGSSSAVVGLLFASIVLVTGSIWGHSAWNTWWRWEPRLVSFLVLWLLLLSYSLLRSFTADDERQGNFSAVLGILCAVNVPIVMFSVNFLDHSQQLHPQVVANRGLEDVRLIYTLIISNIAVILLGVWLLMLKVKNLLLKHELLLFERAVSSSLEG